MARLRDKLRAYAAIVLLAIVAGALYLATRLLGLHRARKQGRVEGEAEAEIRDVRRAERAGDDVAVLEAWRRARQADKN